MKQFAVVILLHVFVLVGIPSHTPITLAQENECYSFRRPTWSPDGAYIACTALCNEKRDIVVIEVATGNIRNLTNTPYDGEVYPSWSPDGTQIAYMSEQPGQPLGIPTV